MTPLPAAAQPAPSGGNSAAVASGSAARPAAAVAPDSDSSTAAIDAALSLPEAASSPQTPLASGSGVLLWSLHQVSGGSGGREAFQNGPLGSMALNGGGGLSVSGLRIGGAELGGFLNESSSAPLPSGYSLGLSWQGGGARFGDGLTSLGQDAGIPLERSLQGLSLHVQAGAGDLAVIGGIGRLQPRHAVLDGAGSSGPYPLGSTAPIDPDTVTVRVDGDPLPRDDYQLDPVTGALEFVRDVIPRTSTIDVRYEQAAANGSEVDRVAGAEYSVAATRGAEIHAGFLSDEPAGGAVASPASITEGPFYGTGGPMTILLSRGAIGGLQQVTVDGAPLVSGVDYVVAPASRTLFIARPVPPGSVVEVTYDYVAPAARGESRASGMVGLGGTENLGARSAIRWSAAGENGGALLDTAFSARVTSRLTLGARLRDVSPEFQAAPGLADTRRQDGIDLGATYLPTERLSLQATWTDAAVPAAMPFLDTTSPGPTVRTQGARLTGDWSPAHGPRLRGDWDQFEENGHPYSRQRLKVQYSRSGWELSTQATHVRAYGGLVAPLPAAPIEQTSLGASLRAHAGAWLQARLEGSADLGSSSESSGSLLSSQVTATPTAALQLAAAYRRSSSPPALQGLLGGGAVLSSASLAALDDFTPGWALAKDPDRQEAPHGIPSPSSLVTLDRLPVGLVTPLTPAGMSLASVLPVPAGFLSFSGGNSVQQRSESVRWQLRPAWALEVAEESYAYQDGIELGAAASSQSITLQASPTIRGLVSGVFRAEASVGRTASSVSSATGFRSAGAFTQITIRLAPSERWQIAGSAYGATGPISSMGPRTVPAGSEQISVGGSFAASCAVGGRRRLYTSLQSRSASGFSAFTSQVASAGMVQGLWAGLGLQIQGEFSRLAAYTAPAVGYHAAGVSISLVSYAGGG